MNALDYVVLLVTILGIAAYGVARTRGRRDLHAYLRGAGRTPWLVIGISVMATQASAVTFMSTPGKGYSDGLGFVQFYFGVPLALVIIAAAFLPIYRKLNVYTAYEFLGKRFDTKTRLLGTLLFLIQRGMGAGLTIYAPAIILSSVFGWPLNWTIILAGTVVVIYTAAGGSDAVNLTQKYQMGVIFIGMTAAFVVVVMELPHGVSFLDAMRVAGGMHKLKAVDFSIDPHARYTFWSGIIGGTFLQLSYFGADQSQVQRYISGTSLRDSRLGLLFNAVCKVPMQFFILLLGVMVFVFYQFQTPPIVFNQAAWRAEDVRHRELQSGFAAAHEVERKFIGEWIDAHHAGDTKAEAEAQQGAKTAAANAETLRGEALKITAARSSANDNDYVFITFILDHLPHGFIGLLIAAFFGAALSSKSAELNALSSTTTVDIYRHLVHRGAADGHYLLATKWFTVFWGVFAVIFALFFHLPDNLVEAVNIVGSLFYGVILGLFITGFFFPRVTGGPVFWAALGGQALVLALYCTLSISYLWLIPIGCVACVLGALVLQPLAGGRA